MKRKTLLLLALTPLVLALAACAAGEAAQEEAGREDGPGEEERGGQASAAVSRPAGAALALPAAGPRVVQTASLRLAVGENAFEGAAERARTTAAGLGGFVVSSTARQGRSGRLVHGTLVLRIPARRYAEAMSSLTRLGRVEAREERGQDVSQEFVDLEARARHLEAVESQLLGLLRQARTVPAALAVQSRLNEVQLQLEQVRGRLRFLEDQVAFATISLELRERTARAGDDGGWGIGDAWREAGSTFVYVAGKTFVVLAAVAPLVLLGIVGVLAARVVLRRRPAGWGFSRR